MLSRDYLRENADAYRTALKNRGSSSDIVDRFLTLDETRRALIRGVEQKKARRNSVSEVIAGRKKERLDASDELAAMKTLSDEIKAADAALAQLEDELRTLELELPNVPHESVPVGADESANRVERTWGEKPKFDFAPKAHWDLGEALGILDFNRGAKITGARFTLIAGKGAKLNRALIDFFLDHASQRGYTEVVPPYIVNADSLRGTGQLPKFEQDLFKLTDRDYYLVPTAEVPVTNIHRDETLDAASLPRYYTAYTPCFRSEAGSYGKDTRGLIRQHQFEKVELVKYVMPQRSWDEHESLTRDAETILQALGLHYRVVTLSTGDMSFSSAKTYDIEVWLPGQDGYREIASSSNFLDFQARRANIRYKTADKKSGFVHTLNSSGLPIGRTLVAILENYQRADGSIEIPEMLRPYMRGMASIVSS